MLRTPMTLAFSLGCEVTWGTNMGTGSSWKLIGLRNAILLDNDKLVYIRAPLMPTHHKKILKHVAASLGARRLLVQIPGWPVH